MLNTKDGDYGYAANKVLEAYLQGMGVEVHQFEKYMEYFECEGHTFILCHGKDDADVFKNMPLTIDIKTENMIDQFIDYNKLSGDIHFIKGDLHQSATTYGHKFRYRSVGSFFGSSEWIHKNFGRTPAAVDIDIIDGNRILETRLELQ